MQRKLGDKLKILEIESPFLKKSGAVLEYTSACAAKHTGFISIKQELPMVSAVKWVIGLKNWTRRLGCSIVDSDNG